MREAILSGSAVQYGDTHFYLWRGEKNQFHSDSIHAEGEQEDSRDPFLLIGNAVS